jgi:hypothetical protein
MQKLAPGPPHGRPASQRGSALAPVLAISTLITIAIGGYLGLAKNSVNQECFSLNEDQAFLAAESGLLLGSKWVLSQNPAWPACQANEDVFGNAYRDGNAINGFDVTVNVVFSGKTATVSSSARNPSLPGYSKQISHDMVQTQISSGEFGLFLDNACQLGGNTKGIRKMDWDGPAHFNSALQLGNPGGGNETHFNDRVSLFNINPETNLPMIDLTHGTGHFGNDYRYGVDGGSGNWDSEFQNTFDPLANKLMSAIDLGGTTELSLNATVNTLTFGVNAGVPYYQFTSPAGVLTTVTYNSGEELKLRIVNQDVSVSGSLKGKVTVYTDAGKSISLPGNLTYADFSTTSFSSTDTANNSGFNKSSSNVLGLYSGADIIIPEGTHYVTGQLFSTNPAGSLRFLNDKKNKTGFYLFGTLAASVFWDSKQGNDQATFKQLWDRRKLCAPGLGFKEFDATGNQVVRTTYSNWNEANFN